MGNTGLHAARIALAFSVSHSIRLHAHKYSRMAKRIFMKLGMNVMPLEATPNFYLLIFHNN
jgi:hypothetical protein